MAAPSGIVWGSIVGGYGRIGIYVKMTTTNTGATVTVQTWFWSKYSVSDSNNTYYYNMLASPGSATEKIGSISISTTVASGDGWSTSNQVKLGESTYSYTRGTSNITRYLYAKLDNVDRVGGTMLANTTFTVPKLASYTVKYNANGGDNAPDAQTKWYGKTLTLSGTKPTRTGYSFQGWALTKSDADNGSWYYQPGGSCGRNENLTLYAVWKANTYTIKFNANGGTGAPGNQTKTYGVTLKLSTTKPTRTNYNFLGWSTSATASTPTYTAGGNYTSNSAATLYAVWELGYTKPRIDNFTVERCKSDGTLDDEGTYALVKLDWECDVNASSVRIQLFKGTTSMGSESIAVSGIRGSVSKIIGGGDLSTENTYTVKVVVADANGQNEASETVYSLKFLIDALAENKGIAFGKTAELEGVADFDFQIYPRKGYMHPVIAAGADLNEEMTPGIYAGDNVSTKPYINCPITAGTFTLEIMSAGPNGQLMQRLTRCDKNIPEVYERWYYTSAWGDWYGGWNYPTLTSAFAMYGTDASANQPRYRKDGRMVEVRGIVTPTADIPGSTENYTIFTLPNGYRPSSPIYVTCQGSGTATWMLRVNTDGKVDFSRYRNGNTWAAALAPNGSSAGTWLPFQVTYFAK